MNNNDVEGSSGRLI